MQANQEAVLAQIRAEQLPEIVKAVAGAYENVDNLTVFDGTDGVNRGMLALIGRVTGRVGAGMIGEVIVSIRRAGRPFSHTRRQRVRRSGSRGITGSAGVPGSPRAVRRVRAGGRSPGRSP